MSMGWNAPGAGANYGTGAAMAANAIAQAAYQERVTNLQIEIAKATDSRTRAELQTLLQQTQDEWEAQKKRSRRLSVVVMVIGVALMVAIAVVAYLLFTHILGRPPF